MGLLPPVTGPFLIAELCGHSEGLPSAHWADSLELITAETVFPGTAAGADNGSVTSLRKVVEM